jgi:DNA-binding NarL/FixJ family response regulator
MSRARVVLADDHAIVLDGLKRILEPSFSLLAVAHDGRELVEHVKNLKPDIAVVDIAMPVLNGLDAFRQCKEAKLATRFVFLTANPDISLAAQAFRLGASGYVLKQAAAEELVTAIREAFNGRTYITPRIANDVMQNMMSTSTAVSPGHELTTREREVLQLLAEGRSLKEAAAVLDVSPRTIEFHKNNIAEKTGLKTMAELARYAVRQGLVSDSG